MAEEVGFEPTELSFNGFQDRRLQPLGHPSELALMLCTISARGCQYELMLCFQDSPNKGFAISPPLLCLQLETFAGAIPPFMLQRVF